MAGKAIGISFTIGASVGASVASAFASVNEKLRATQQSFRNASRQSRQLSEAAAMREKRDAAASRASQQLKLTGRVDDSLRRELSKLNLAYAEAAKKAGVYGQGLEEIRRRQAAMAQSVEASQRRIASLNRIQGARNVMQTESGNRRAAVGNALGGVAAAIGMAAPIKIGMEFESAMSRVAAISGATGANFEALRNQARELGASTVWSAKEAAEGMTFLSMAGFKTHETLAAMPGMLSLASAGAMDLASTADIASNILSGFGFEAGQMGYVGDVLAKTFTSSNTSIQSLGESFKYCGPAAKAAGQSFQDVAAMIGKLGDAGIQGSMAGTGLSAIISRLAKPPKEARVALKQLGVAIADASGKMRPMGDVFADIEKQMGRFSEQERIALAKSLYGAEHFSKGFVLQMVAANGSLKELSDSLNEEGFADKVAARQNDNFMGDLKQLNSAYQEVGITLFEVLNPALRQITQNIIPVVQATGVWIRENPRLVQGLTLLGGAFVALKAGALAFTLINSYRKTFGAGLATLRGQSQLAFGGISSCLSSLRAEFTRPVNFRAPVASIQTGANSINRSFARIRNAVSQTAMRLRSITPASVMAGAAAAASGTAAAAGRVGWNTLRIGVRGVGMAFRTAFGPVSLLMMGLSLGVDYIMENWDKIAPYFQALWDKVKAVFNAVLGWMEPIFNKIMGFVGPIVDGVKTVGGTIGKGVSKVGDALGGVWDSLVGNDKEKARKEEAAKAELAQKKEQEALFSNLPKEVQANLKASNPGLAIPQSSPSPEIAAPAQAFVPQANAAITPPQPESRPKKLESSPKSESAPAKSAAKAAPPETQIVQPQVQVELSITQNGIPDAEFATGVMNAIKSRQAELEAMISAIVNEQARLAYG